MGVPGSLRNAVIMVGDPEHYRAWGELEFSIRTGQPAFDHAFGVGVFDYFATHPEAAAVFDAAMTDFTDSQGVAAAYDFSAAGTVVDVAGGHGSLLAAVLRANPTVKGILFDLPHVIDRARTRGFLGGDLESRARSESGSFFETVPGGGDLYLMKHIIHDWDDDHCLRILANCRRAMNPGGRVVVVDAVIPPGNDPHPAKFGDLNMLVMTHGGKERTEEEFRTLFQQAGFQLTNIVPTRALVCCIEGRAA
jgi:SAM-dependent methyltransferase